MRSPFAALADRFRRRPAAERAAPPAPLPADMGARSGEFQARVDEARERLRRDIPPPPPDEE